MLVLAVVAGYLAVKVLRTVVLFGTPESDGGWTLADAASRAWWEATHPFTWPAVQPAGTASVGAPRVSDAVRGA